MGHTLGIDIGTFESKGVLVNHYGEIVSQANKSHKMLVPKPGWAEHRPEEDWWDDFCFISSTILSKTGIAPEEIKAVACSATACKRASRFTLLLCLPCRAQSSSY